MRTPLIVLASLTASFALSLTPSLAPAASQRQPIRPAPYATPAIVHANTPTLKRMIRTASLRYRVPEGLIAGTIKVETDFNSEAVSAIGSQGLMQLSPTTAHALKVTDPADPWQSIAGGSKLLGSYLELYDGNVRLAIAAYCVGPSNVASAGGKVPPIGNTPRYVASVLHAGRQLGYSNTTIKL